MINSRTTFNIFIVIAISIVAVVATYLAAVILKPEAEKTYEPINSTEYLICRKG